jgi:hypothetical protein
VEREYETDRNDNEVLLGYKVGREVNIKLRALGTRSSPRRWSMQESIHCRGQG